MNFYTEIETICNPVFDLIGADSFEFRRISNNKEIIRLYSNILFNLNCRIEIYNPLIINKKFNNFTDIFFFASSKGESEKIKNQYFYYYDEIQQFINYFYIEIDSLSLAGINGTFSNYLVKQYKYLKKLEDFYKSIQIYRVPIFIKNSDNHVYLSKSETQVLLLLIKGKSYKQIAKDIGITFKTVETYITRIKKKANCTYKRELIDCLPKYFFSVE